jgi:hypothetical protein
VNLVFGMGKGEAYSRMVKRKMGGLNESFSKDVFTEHLRPLQGNQKALE